MAGVVIADAGPLIAFAQIDRLDLLEKLFEQVLITESVWQECSIQPGDDRDRIESSIQAGWMQRQAFSAPSLSPGLGQGESDSISLAMQAPDRSLLILDDRLARRYALRAGLQIIGTVRLLHECQKRGLIPSAENCLLAMAENGYRVSLELLDQVRRR